MSEIKEHAISLGDGYYLCLDRYNGYTMKEYEDKGKKVLRRITGYSHELVDAIDECLERRIGEQAAKDLTDIKEAVMAMEKSIAKWSIKDDAKFGDGYQMNVDNFNNHFITQDRGKRSDYRVSGYCNSNNAAIISLIRHTCMATEVSDLKGVKKLVKSINKDVNGWKKEVTQ